MPRCWVIGDTAIDLMPEGDKYLKLPGGTGANVAVALSKLGVRSSLICKLGNDPLAAFLTDVLERERVDTRYLSFSNSHRTSLILVSVDENGEREFTFMVKPSADSQLEESDIPAFEQDDWLCVSAFILAQAPSRNATFIAMDQARKAGATICVDANTRAQMWDDPSLMVPKTLEALKMADVAKMSEEELLLLSGTDSIENGIADISRWPARLKVITRAEKGAIFLADRSEKHVEGFDVPVVDMTGAGDAFFAALVSRLIPLQDWTEDQLIEAVSFSNACGAFVVGEKGAMSALPDLDTVNQFIMERRSECR